MVALVRTVAYLGLEARAVEVAVPRWPPGLPRIHRGRPARQGREAKAANGCRPPCQPMGLLRAAAQSGSPSTFSPADLPKDGSHYEPADRAGRCWQRWAVTDAEQLGDWIVVGELALEWPGGRQPRRC